MWYGNHCIDFSDVLFLREPLPERRVLNLNARFAVKVQEAIEARLDWMKPRNNEDKAKLEALKDYYYNRETVNTQYEPSPYESARDIVHDEWAEWLYQKKRKHEANGYSVNGERLA